MITWLQQQIEKQSLPQQDYVKNDILNFPIHSKLYKNRGKYPAIDNAVYDWFCSLRCLVGKRKPLPISRSLLQACASYEAKVQGVINLRPQMLGLQIGGGALI